MKLLRIPLAALLALLLLCAALPMSALAVDTDELDFSDGLEPILLDYMSAHNLSEENFSLGFYDTGTGTTYYFCEDAWHVAGSMYKLPLNMVYTDLIAEGLRRPSAGVGGYTIEGAMYNSMVYSDNDAAHALLDGLLPDYDSSWADMWHSLARYTDLDPATFPARQHVDNLMTPHFMIETLKYLYDNSVQYAGVLENMHKANRGNYLRYTYEGPYEIAHKYGSYQGWLNDCAIVYTPKPFLLVVFTRYALPSGERVLSDLRDICIAYALYLQEHGTPVQNLNPREQALLDLRRAMGRVRKQHETEQAAP